jgi:tRNA (guanine37-N1)-methyltransferase
VEDIVRVFCEDGRDFIRSVALRSFQSPFPPYAGPKLSRTKEAAERRKGNVKHASPHPQVPRPRISHFVMNLPDTAIQFLDAFRGLLSADGLREVYDILPMIHCHCFTREIEKDKAEADIRAVIIILFALRSSLAGTDTRVLIAG